MKKTTIEQSNQTVSESLSQSAMHDKAPAFAKNQHVKAFNGAFYGIVRGIELTYAIVELEDPKFGTVSVPYKHLEISYPFELKWIESLLAAQKRHYKLGSMEAAIAAN